MNIMKNLFTSLVLLLLVIGSSWGQSVLISPTGDGGFETGTTISSNNWLIRNNQSNGGTDNWFAGSVPVQSAGTRCGYIGPIASSGATWTYSELGNSGSTSIIHLYHDVVIPANQAIVVISFKWKALGEGAYPVDADNLKVFFTPPAYTPSASVAVPSAYRIGASFYNLSSATWNSSGDITVIGTPGSTHKLVFSWYSNTSNIVNPPAAIDEVSVSAYTSVAADGAPVNFTATAVTGTGMTVGWTDNSTNELGFRVYRSTDNINFLQVGSDIPSTTGSGTGTAYSQVQTGLVPGVTYYYRIAAYYALESPYLTGSQSTSVSTLAGTKTVGGGGTPDYPTIAAAIAALNLNGVGPGGVTFNVAGGHTETFATATAGYITATNGSADSPIVFQKSGAGANPIITAAAGTGTSDAIIAIGGCDYVTFNGINLTENSGNTNATSRMEWGYAILKSSGVGVDGSQNITISNCTINLNYTNQASIGIYSNNHTLADATLQLAVTNFAGTNSNNKVFGNTINCFTGISLIGFADANGTTFLDQNNEIGKDGANFITNIGGNTVSNAGAYGILGQYQHALKVANNSITSTMAGNSLAAYGISLFNGKNSSYDIYNNSISIQYSGPGNSSFYGISADMSTAGTSNTVNVFNNEISNCTFPTFTSGTVRFINLNNLGVTANVYGNTISSNDVGDGSLPSTGAIMYLVCNKSSAFPGILNVYNNTVSGNQRRTNSAGTMPGNYIWVTGSGSQLNLYGNDVTNNIARNGSSINGISSSFTQGSVRIYDNTVTNLTEANATTYGISLSSASSNVKLEIFRNAVSNIEGGSATTKISGIYHSGSGTGTYSYIHNNMISDLRATIASGTGGDIVAGINNSGANYLSVYNNSVYLNASSIGTNFHSSAFYSTTSASAVLDVRNNILVNTSTPAGTGVTAALRFSNTNWTTFFSSLSDNNDLYAGTPGLYNALFFDGTNKDQVLAEYKGRMFPRESKSISIMPPFVNTTSGSTDLHLQPILTPCESGGSVISGNYLITSDYDGDPRFPDTGYPVGSSTPYAPDMGADEFGGIPADIIAPVITYTPIASTDVTGDRTLTVTITDASGVPTSGAGLPKLYWKINSGAYTAAPDPVVSGTTYTFSFGNGAVLGNTVSYYVVAQDMATTPNVTANAFVGATGYTANPPACSTPPASPSIYTIVPSYTGTFHVGVGKTYTTLTAAAADLNTKVLTGPVTLILDDAAYASETYPVVFNANAGSSAVNTLTLKPNTGVSPVFSYATASATGIIELNGIDYLTVDGSNNGTNSRNLTIVNTKTGTNGTCALAVKTTASDPATNITVKNCILKSVRVDNTTSSNNTSAIRFISAGAGFDNVVIDNNTINSAYNGIQLWGFANNGLVKNVQITNNIIGSTNASEAVTARGIDIQAADNTLISNNEILGASDGTTSKPLYGIALGNATTNTKIRKNSIHGFIHPADDGVACYGIYCNTDASTVTEISNNLVYDLRNGGNGTGVIQANTYGIFFNSGGNTRILHNTINLSGAYLSASKNASSACIGVNNTATAGNIEVRNNILRNGLTTIGGLSSTGRAYGIMLFNSPAIFSIINNNDYFIDGYNGAIAQNWNGSTAVNFPDLASWQVFTGQETNSVNIDPVFTTPSNLLPTTVLMNNAGSYSTLVTTDYNGATRSNPPDIGAYEYAPDPLVITNTADAITEISVNLQGQVNATGFTVNSYFDYGLTNAYGSSIVATPASVTGTTLTAIQAGISGLLPSTTYHFRARGVTGGGVTVYGNDVTVTTNAVSANKTLNLKFYLEGLFNTGTSLMNKAQGLAGDQFAGTVADKVTVELHNVISPYASVYSYSNVDLNTNGTLSINTLPAAISGSYYLVIKHRNSIETWSKLPYDFSGDGPFSYDFSTNATQAFGNNLKLMGTKYAIYSGDVNQDGIVDAGDLIPADNDAASFTNGYTTTDSNGDGIVNSSDIVLINNNASGFISTMHPE
jgi:hypothetical protein